MRVVDVEPFSLSLSKPLRTASGEISEREGFLVRVDHAGETGVGEATPLEGWTETLSACREALARVGQLESPLDSLSGCPAARHGLASATLDAAARADGVSLAGHLAGTTGMANHSVRVNATVGDGDTDETLAAVESAVDDGFGAVKLKVGVRDVRSDVERLEAVREAYPTVTLRVDTNGAWDAGSAETFLNATSTLDLDYVEQPLAAGDLAGHAALRGRGSAIALDETLCRHPVEDVLQADAADVLVLKPMVLGGPDVAHRTAVTARDCGVDSVVTTTIDGAYARATAVHVAAGARVGRPCGLATAGMLESDLVEPDPVPVVDGVVEVPAGPGVL